MVGQVLEVIGILEGKHLKNFLLVGSVAFSSLRGLVQQVERLLKVFGEDLAHLNQLLVDVVVYLGFLVMDRLLAFLSVDFIPLLPLLMREEFSLGIVRSFCDYSLGHADSAARFSLMKFFSLTRD